MVAVLSIGWSVIAVAVLYPAFQAMVLRWWISGLRFGELTVTSHLRTRAVYALYLRFVWMCAARRRWSSAIAAAIALAVIGGLDAWLGKGTPTELLQTAIADRHLCDRCARLFDHLPSDGETAALEAGFESIELTGRRGARPREGGAGDRLAGRRGFRRRPECRRDLTMAAAGKAIFFDGVTSARRPVLIELAPDGVVMRDEEQRDMLARWPYDELDHLAAPDGVLRLGHIGARDTRAARSARRRRSRPRSTRPPCRSTAPARASGAAG